MGLEINRLHYNICIIDNRLEKACIPYLFVMHRLPLMYPQSEYCQINTIMTHLNGKTKMKVVGLRLV